MSAAAAQNRTNGQPPSTVAAMARTTMTAADATRLARSPDEAPEAAVSYCVGNRGRSFTASRSGPRYQSAEPALAAPVFGDRGLEGRAVEIGPVGRNEDELAVGGLPQQKIRQALLAAGADNEIGVGQVGGVEMSADEVGGNISRR